VLLRNFITPLHTATKRDYITRMCDDKVACMVKAKEYGFDYWDGDRRFGYGGYRYLPGRWKPVAEALIQTYDLTSGSRVLDVGCGKAFLLYELQLLEPELELHGLDFSEYALAHTHPELRANLLQGTATDLSAYDDSSIDLVISLNTLHNLPLPQLEDSLSEIARVGKHAYIAVESFRNEQELFNLQCWALTCESFFRAETWIKLFGKHSQNIDYEFIYFE